MPTINEAYTAKDTRGIRINQKLIELCNKTGLSPNSIMESCLVYFATLDDDKRIQFLAKYDPDKIDVSKIIEPEENTIRDRAITAARANLGRTPSRTSEKLLITVGLTLLGSIIE